LGLFTLISAQVFDAVILYVVEGDKCYFVSFKPDRDMLCKARLFRFILFPFLFGVSLCESFREIHEEFR
jgi:hypothetical protein